MRKIHVLDQNTINQIAAGEVIDRPASIVKELMENAIDAGATMISVEIKDGGTSLIRITDNGSGIEKDDIKVAFLRHATSKIKTALDLISVSSLGFRGEALSSIASVCQVELITKTEDAITGIRYKIEGGKEVTFEEIGAPEGTTFIVKNIFFNTPARRKFLKTAQTEAGYISEIVEKIALSHPEISISFINNNQTKIHTSGNGNLKDVIYNIYGRDIANNLLEINCSNEFIKMTGYIGKAIISKGNRSFENYFINGRYIKSNIISKAIEDGYKFILMQHKYPFTAINFEIDQDLLDVNVHPAKMELRFRKGEAIYPFIMDSIHDTLVEKPNIIKVELNEEKPNEEKIARAPEPFEKTRTEINHILGDVPDYKMAENFIKSINDENIKIEDIKKQNIREENNYAVDTPKEKTEQKSDILTEINDVVIKNNNQETENTHFSDISKNIEEKGAYLFRELTGQCVGVHVRRTDHTEAIANSPLVLFAERMKKELETAADTSFFVATDDKEVRRELKELLPDAKLIFPQSDVIDRDSKEGIEEAFIEMLALSKCRKILGSYNSTFSLLPSYIGNIPLETVHK